jgi:hypothetical protein
VANTATLVRAPKRTDQMFRATDSYIPEVDRAAETSVSFSLSSMEPIPQVDFTEDVGPCQRGSCSNPQYPQQTGTLRKAVRNHSGVTRMYCQPCYEVVTGT